MRNVVFIKPTDATTAKQAITKFFLLSINLVVTLPINMAIKGSMGVK